MFFENGNSTHTRSSCIEHAHLNILPITFNFKYMMPEFFEFNKELIFSQDLEELYSNIQTDMTYRMVGTFSSGFYSTNLYEKPESQFMRKKLSKLLQHDKWDWNNFGFQQSVYCLINSQKEINVL